MNHKTLPYLHCLKTAMTNLAAAAGADPGAAMQAAIANRLLDNMIAQGEAAPALKAETYVRMLQILPAAESVLAAQPSSAAGQAKASSDVEKMAPGNAATNAALELKALCAGADPEDFDRFMQLSGELQCALFALGTPAAQAVCKSVLQIETDYVVKFDAAVVAHVTAAAAASVAPSAARNARAYDEKALLAFIRKSFPAESGVDIKSSGYVSGGFSKFTMSITLANAGSLPESIILRGDAAATFGGASVVDEYRLIKLMYDNGVSVPKPLALEETGTVFGSPFLLVEKKPGTVIGHMFNLPKPNKAVCESVGASLAAIHRVPLAALGNQINNANGRNSDKMLQWLDEGYNAWKPLNMPSPVFETAFEWLRRHASLNDKAPRTLVHGDYGLNNLLIHEDKVSTILDWEFAHIGNPAYDLGYFYFQGEALSSWEHLLDSYARTGVPLPDEEQLNYSILFAATRLGVMVCQTAAVFTSGAEPGIAGAAVVGGNYYEETIRRIAFALDRVL